MTRSPPLDGQSYGPELEIIFSFAEGYVWASWPGTSASVRLGPYKAVTTMMSDFLAQCILGERLMQGRTP